MARLHAIIASLATGDVETVLQYVRAWNATARGARVAQRVLAAVLAHVPAADLAAMPSMRATVAALLPYTERHYKLAVRACQQACFAEHLWQAVKLADRLRPSREHPSPSPSRRRRRGNERGQTP